MNSNNFPDSANVNAVYRTTQFCSQNEMDKNHIGPELINNQDCYWSDVDSSNQIVNRSISKESSPHLKESLVYKNYEVHNTIDAKLYYNDNTIIETCNYEDSANNKGLIIDEEFMDSNTSMPSAAENIDKIEDTNQFQELSNLFPNNVYLKPVYDDNILTNNGHEPKYIQSHQNIGIKHTYYQSDCSVDERTTLLSSQTISLITSSIISSLETTNKNFSTECQSNDFQTIENQFINGNFDTSSYNNQSQIPYNNNCDTHFPKDQSNSIDIQPDFTGINPGTLQHGQVWNEINNNIPFGVGYLDCNYSGHTTPHSNSNFAGCPTSNPSYLYPPCTPCSLHNPGNECPEIRRTQFEDPQEPYGHYQPPFMNDPPNNVHSGYISLKGDPYEEPRGSDASYELPPAQPERAPVQQDSLGQNQNMPSDSQNTNLSVPRMIKQIIAVTPGGQIHKIDPLQDAPKTFKEQSDEVNWIIASYLNSKKARFEIEEGLSIPEQIDQTKEEHFISLKNKEIEKIKEWAAKPNPFLKHDLSFLEKEFWLWEMTKGLMQNLISDPEVANSSLNELQNKDISSTSIQRIPQALKSLKKVINSLRGYTPSKAKELFEKLEGLHVKSGKGTLTDNVIQKLIDTQKRKTNNQMIFEWIFLRECNNLKQRIQKKTCGVSKSVKENTKLDSSPSELLLNKSQSNLVLLNPSTPFQVNSPTISSTSDPLASDQNVTLDIQKTSSKEKSGDMLSTNSCVVPPNPTSSTNTHNVDSTQCNSYEAYSPYASPNLVICSPPQSE